MVYFTPTGKFKLISQQEFLVESLEVLIKGPMIHNRQGINIPGRSLVMVNASIGTGELLKDQVFEVKSNFLLTDEHPNLVVVPVLHVIQGKSMIPFP